nr:putative ribonuclease h protein [Quercus suber]
MQLGVQNLEVELDVKVIVDLINSRNSSNAAYSSLLFDCRLLLDKIPHTKVKHVFREANRFADALSRKGCNANEEFLIFDVPPSDDVSALVYADEIGESFCRQVVANLTILVA